MKKIYKDSNAQRLAAYSAMAAVIIAGTAEADAEVIYTDLEDVTIEVGDVYELDIDGDATPDFFFRASYTTGTAGTWSFGSVFGYYTSPSVGGSSNQVIGYVGPYYAYGSFLEEGDEIGGEGPWLNYPSYGNSAVLVSNFYGVAYGAFPGAGEGYLGVQFITGGNLHYAWIRLEADIDPAYITLMDMAYEDVPNQAIEAGATESVSIAELPAGLAGIYSYGDMIYIQNNGMTDAFASVYNMSGQLVSSTSLMEGANRINMQHVTAGNYVVKIISGEGVYSKQLFVN